MSIALKADHMVAAMRLLRWSSTSRAGCRMQLEVLQRSLILLSQLAISLLRNAEGEFAVPSLVTSATEGKGAIFADREQVVSSLEFLVLSVLLSIRLIV